MDITGIALCVVLMLNSGLSLPPPSADIQNLGSANMETLNREVRRHLLSSVTKELSTVKQMIDTMQPEMSECQTKTNLLMGDCIHCVNDLCQNRIKMCRGVAKVVIPATGGVSVSNHQNEAGESTVTVCSILQDNSKSCQTIMNPDGVIVSSISNMGNNLQVNLRGAVNDLGGNVGTFVNGVQTFIGGYHPFNTSLNASQWDALLRETNKQFGKIARTVGTQMANIGINMHNMGMNMGRRMNHFGKTMNHFARQMTRGMSHINRGLSHGLSNMFRNIFSNFGQFEMPTSSGAVVNINSNIQNQNNPPEVSTVFHQSSGPSNLVNINEVFHSSNSNPPNVVNINSQILNKNGKIQHQTNAHYGIDGSRIAADINNHISNIFSNIFGRKKRAVPQAGPVGGSLPLGDPLVGGLPVLDPLITSDVLGVVPSTTPSATVGYTKKSSSTKRKNKSKKSMPIVAEPTTTMAKPEVTTTAAPVPEVITTAPVTTPLLSVEYVPELILPTIPDLPNIDTIIPKEAAVIINKPKTSELSFDPEVIQQKIGTPTKRVPNSGDDSPTLQALLGLNVPTESAGIPVFQETTPVPFTPLNVGIEKIFKSLTVPGDSTADYPDCGTIVLDNNSCSKYKSQCATCAEYIDKNKGDILRQVCGATLVENGEKLKSSMAMLNEVYDQVIASSNLISKVEFKRSSINPGTLSVRGIKVTATVKGQPLTFISKSPLYVFDMSKTAKSLSDQIWQYWSQNNNKRV